MVERVFTVRGLGSEVEPALGASCEVHHISCAVSTAFEIYQRRRRVQGLVVCVDCIDRSAAEITRRIARKAMAS